MIIFVSLRLYPGLKNSNEKKTSIKIFQLVSIDHITGNGKTLMAKPFKANLL